MEKSVQELLEMLKQKKELVKDIEKMWKDGNIEKLTVFLEKAGVKTDIKTVEKALAYYQQKNTDKLKAAEIDESLLETVTGGGYGFCDGTADCDSNFKDYPETVDRCYLIGFCDQAFGDPSPSPDEDEQNTCCVYSTIV